MLDQVTPVILTFNEEENIEHSVSRLGWAKDIVVVDSFSTDDTLSILTRFSNVRVYQREFDNHANQWNYAIHETDINKDWVLALDADYILSDEFISELESLDPALEDAGYETEFTYCIHGKPLRGSLYPPVVVLCKHVHARYTQDGHTQRVIGVGKVGKLRSKILHDDRKPFGRWLASQKKYMALEAELIYETPFAKLSWPDKTRKMVFIAPFLTFIYCLFYKKLILDGIPGLHYSALRTIAEIILTIEQMKLLLKINIKGM